jgi:UDP-perosamine 4-acetyltransferase
MTPKNCLLLAAGGHGRVVLDTLLSLNQRMAGIVDGGLVAGETVFAVPVLGSDSWLETQSPAIFRLANGAGAPTTPLRRRLYEHWSARGFEFASLCHPSAIVGHEVHLQPGSQVLAGVVVQPRCVIGINAVLNTRSSIDHDCHIGAHAFIAPGAVLCGGVRVGVGTFIGAGAVLLPGVQIGDGAIVGAGATVTQDVAARQQVVGTPARIDRTETPL